MPSLDLGSVRGPQGEQGIQGIQGIQGVQGAQGVPGAQGATGNGVSGVALISGDHSPGTVDTYRMSFTDGSYMDFTVYNGEDACFPNAGAHNAIYRGKNLGTSVTAEQYAAISAGTFDDMFIGDYWTIGDDNYRIAAFDYWLHNGDMECTTHHVVLVPDTKLYGAKMNESNITTGGYVGSVMYTTNLETAKNTISTAFGSGHILSHRELLTNAVADGKASGWAWYDSTVELMNEAMVYGHGAWGSALGYETGADKSQLPLFALDHSRICNRKDWWLRDVVSATDFALVSYYGDSRSISSASYALGVRPAFGIKA